MNFRNGRDRADVLISRAFALMIPTVTVSLYPNGDPIATAQSPTLAASELPILAASMPAFFSTWITARSVSGSTPISFAG